MGEVRWCQEGEQVHKLLNTAHCHLSSTLAQCVTLDNNSIMWLSVGIQNIQVHFHEKDKSCYQLRGFALDPNNGPQTGFTFFVALALFIYRQS